LGHLVYYCMALCGCVYVVGASRLAFDTAERPSRLAGCPEYLVDEATSRTVPWGLTTSYDVVRRRRPTQGTNWGPWHHVFSSDLARFHRTVCICDTEINRRRWTSTPQRRRGCHRIEPRRDLDLSPLTCRI